MPSQRIYVSSTYADLLVHRSAAARVIEDCGHIAVDSYAAGPHPTLEQCLLDVDSCDAMVGIIGLRHGWVGRCESGRGTHGAG